METITVMFEEENKIKPYVFENSSQSKFLRIKYYGETFVAVYEADKHGDEIKVLALFNTANVKSIFFLPDSIRFSA